MKKYLMFLCAMALVVGMMGSARAATYTAIEDPNPDQYIGWYESHSWTFDLTDDGFDPLTQQVTSASVEMNLSDNDSNLYWWDVELALLIVDTEFAFDWTPLGSTDITLTSFVTLNASGTVNASVTSLWGDFFFLDATLTAEATEPVPEPATVALLGIGIVGLTGAEVRRRRKKKTVENS